MAQIALENGRISNFEGLVTLTLDRVIPHTVVHHSSTSTYMPNFIEIKETFCGCTYVRMHARMYIPTDGHLKPVLLGRLCQKIHVKMECCRLIMSHLMSLYHSTDHMIS